MIKALMTLELRRMARSLAAKAILLFALLASGYAVWSGAVWRDAHTTILTDYEQHIAAKQQSWLEDLAAINTGEKAPSPYDARPMDVEEAATHPVAPLGHLAIGHAELMPTRVNISPWNNQMSMIEPYEFDNPTTLALGRFDLAFFTVVVLPLLMIALSFDVIASDRARGTIKLLLSNPVSTRSIIAARLFVRNGLLYLVAITATCAGFSIGGANSMSYSLLWLGTSIAYCLFWFCLTYLVVTRLRRSEAAVASLISLWALFTLAIPALTGSAGEALYPQPSKLAYLSDARLAENTANKQTAELTKGFLADHPDLTVGDENVPGYYRGVFLANEQIRLNTAPVVKAFEESSKKRHALIEKLQYLSPAVIAQRAFFKIAGSDYEQAQTFIKTASDTLTEQSIQVRAAVLSRNRITQEQYDALPSFTFKMANITTVSGQIIIPILFLLLVSGMLLSFAIRKTPTRQI